MTVFSEFMQAWLYGPQGYYRNIDNVGKAGDFYTAVSASRFFGGSIANHIVALKKEEKLPDNLVIVEIGAHAGHLMADVIQFLFTLERDWLPKLRFVVIEPLQEVAVVQQRYFAQSFGEALTVEIYESLDALEAESLFVFANELLDAYPCEVVDGDSMLCVDDSLHLEFQPASGEVRAWCARYGLQKGELPWGYVGLAKSLARFPAVRFLTFDYGERPFRQDMSMRIYAKHKTYPLFEEGLNLAELQGCSDLTYDVSFDLVERVFTEAGFRLESYSSQAKAMIEFGIADLLELLRAHADEESYLRETSKVRTLLDPHFMGERFKRICLVK